MRPLVAVGAMVPTHTPLAALTQLAVTMELSGYANTSRTAVMLHEPTVAGTPRTNAVDGEPTKVDASTSGSSGCAALRVI